MADLAGSSLGKFGGREKAFLVLLAVAATGTTGYRAVIRPRTELVAKTRKLYHAAQEELRKLEAQRPNVEARRAQVQTMRDQGASTYRELEGLEEGLLGRDDFDVLLQRVSANQKRFRLTMNGIKPMREEAERQPTRADKSAEPIFYRKLSVQIDANAAFDDLIAYIKALELQGPYQHVRGVRVKLENQDTLRPRTLILLQTLLADTPEQLAKRRKEVFAMVARIAQRQAKDPFLPVEKPREEETLVGLQLSGVFGEGADMTALINGDSYHVGEEIEGKRITAIQADRVVFEQGARRFFLYTAKSGAP